MVARALSSGSRGHAEGMGKGAGATDRAEKFGRTPNAETRFPGPTDMSRACLTVPKALKSVLSGTTDMSPTCRTLVRGPRPVVLLAYDSVDAPRPAPRSAGVFGRGNGIRLGEVGSPLVGTAFGHAGSVVARPVRLGNGIPLGEVETSPAPPLQAECRSRVAPAGPQEASPREMPFPTDG